MLNHTVQYTTDGGASGLASKNPQPAAGVRFAGVRGSPGRTFKEHTARGVVFLAVALAGPAVSALADPSAPQLEITSPRTGEVFFAGSTIVVEVTSQPGLQVQTVLVVGANGAATSSQAPFRVSFEIPIEAFGPYDLTAFGRGSGPDAFYGSESVRIDVKAEAVLQSLEIPPNTYVSEQKSWTLLLGESAQLSLTGIFSDGIDREIPLSDVAWESADPGIVKVSATGSVTGVTTGNTSLTAKAYGLQGSLEFFVVARLN